MRPHKILYPFGALYGLILKLRNKWYDKGWLKSEMPTIFTICVGNISAGGTGKTPMIEYLIAILKKENRNIAVLSRGYKRKTKGFLELNSTTSVNDAGDESFQIAKKHKDLKVFVNENRVEGVKKIMKAYPETNVLLLDDAFQHRKIKAHLNILLTRFDQLYSDDYYLPAGYLRDHKSRADQAEVVVVTKCPTALNETDKKIIEEKLTLKSNQQLFFSGLVYQSAKLLFSNNESVKIEGYKLLVITGIAQPKPFIDYVSAHYKILEHFAYPDHFAFKLSDLSKWKSELIGYDKVAIITTEKDAVRLLPFKKELMGLKVFYVPILVKLYGGEQKFKRLVLKDSL